jgi:hypothetical protein
MAKDGAFFSWAARLHPRTGRPAAVVALQGALACLAVFIGSARVDDVLLGVTFADAALQAPVAVVHLRYGAGKYAPPVAAWIFLVVEVGLAIGSPLQAPRQSAYGVLMLAFGAVAWLVWRRPWRSA